MFNELSRLLDDREYFTGEAATLADLMVAPQLDFLAQTPEWAPLTSAAPNLPSWLARMHTRPSMQATAWDKVAARTA